MASTTRNVNGVYDMLGGAHEYVMANMVDTTGAYYYFIGSSWLLITLIGVYNDTNAGSFHFRRYGGEGLPNYSFRSCLI